MTGSIPWIAGLWPGSITITGWLAGGVAAREGLGEVCARLVLRDTLDGAWLVGCAGGTVDDADRAGGLSGVNTTVGVGAGARAALHPVTEAAVHSTPTARAAERSRSRRSIPLR